MRREDLRLWSASTNEMLTQVTRSGPMQGKRCARVSILLTKYVEKVVVGTFVGGRACSSRFVISVRTWAVRQNSQFSHRRGLSRRDRIHDR